MKLTTSLGLVTVLFLAWVAGCGDDSSGTSPGGTGGTADGGEPAAGGSPSTAGTAGTTSAGAQNVAGDTSSAGAGGAGTETPCALADDWEVVDDYVYPGATRTNAVGVAADSAGNVLVVGLALGT